jgi:hypothetical protein
MRTLLCYLDECTPRVQSGPEGDDIVRIDVYFDNVSVPIDRCAGSVALYFVDFLSDAAFDE